MEPASTLTEANEVIWRSLSAILWSEWETELISFDLLAMGREGPGDVS